MKEGDNQNLYQSRAELGGKMEVERLSAAGKELGYAGQELREWVESERSQIRDDRDREREEKDKEQEDTKEIAEKRNKEHQAATEGVEALQGITAEEA